MGDFWSKSWSLLHLCFFYVGRERECSQPEWSLLVNILGFCLVWLGFFTTKISWCLAKALFLSFKFYFCCLHLNRLPALAVSLFGFFFLWSLPWSFWISEPAQPDLKCEGFFCGSVLETEPGWLFQLGDNDMERNQEGGRAEQMYLLGKYNLVLTIPAGIWIDICKPQSVCDL